MSKIINKNDYLKQLSKYIFWDLNIDKLDYKLSKQNIIERIAQYGTENDDRIMNKLYSTRTIKKCLKRSDDIDYKTVMYYAFVLKEKEKNFRCYFKKNFQIPI